MPNGKYIHGTKKLNGKYYDSDLDSGAIKASKAEYYTLLGIDANDYVDEKFQGFDDSDKVVYQKGGSFINGITIVDENGEEKAVDSNKGITVKEAKNKEYNSFIQDDAKEEKKNFSSNVSELSKLLPKTDYVSRVVLNKKNKYRIHYYNVDQNEYFDYMKKIEEKGCDSIDPGSPEEAFLGKNKDNTLINIYYDAATKIIDLGIQRQ